MRSFSTNVFLTVKVSRSQRLHGKVSFLPHSNKCRSIHEALFKAANNAGQETINVDENSLHRSKKASIEGR